MEATIATLQSQSTATQGCPNCYPARKPAAERDPRYRCPSCAQEPSTHIEAEPVSVETHAMDKDSPARQHVQFASTQESTEIPQVPSPPKQDKVTISKKGHVRANTDEKWDGWLCEDKEKEIWILVDPKTKQVLGRY